MRSVLFAAVFCVLGGSICRGDLIISQYYEGSSSNKWIELTNAGGTAVDLGTGNYQLSLFSNGNSQAWKSDGTPSVTSSLTGVLNSGGSLLLRNSNAALPGYALGTISGSVNFNGNDSVVLWTGAGGFATSSVIDAFGVTSNSFGDLSYARNANVLSGSAVDFQGSEWTLFSNADVDTATVGTTQHLGTHIFSVPEPTASFVLAIACTTALLRRRRLALARQSFASSGTP